MVETRKELSVMSVEGVGGGVSEKVLCRAQRFMNVLRCVLRPWHADGRK